MTELEKALLIACIVAVGLGALFFFAAGIFHTKKDKAIVIEKTGSFKGVYYEGWHYFLPIIYQRRGTYVTAPQVIRVQVKDGPLLDVTYKITDVKKYHYEGIPIEAIVNRVRNENKEITIDILKKAFAERGIEFINIKRGEK